MDGSFDVLIAEDNPVNQMVAVRMLRKLGIRTGTAANGLEAIQSLERQHYDIVLMDIEMPDMNGIKATKIIRERWPKGRRSCSKSEADNLSENWITRLVWWPGQKQMERASPRMSSWFMACIRP